MKPALRSLFALLTVLCGTMIAGAAVQEAHAGVIFEKACVLEGETSSSADFIASKSAKEAAKAQFRKEAAGLETKVIRSGREGTGKIVGVGTKGRGSPTYRPKPDGSYSVGKKGDVKHYRPTQEGGHTVN